MFFFILLPLNHPLCFTDPIYVSPLKDMGYDIADYQAIDPRYGSIADWDVLVKDLHDRGMKIMWVPTYLFPICQLKFLKDGSCRQPHIR